jgi:hypothetical protein
MQVQGFQQKKEDNPYNYTDDQLTDRRLAVKTMLELWPAVSKLHAEWVYDLCKNIPDSELEALMKRVDEVPPRQEKNIMQ